MFRRYNVIQDRRFFFLNIALLTSNRSVSIAMHYYETNFVTDIQFEYLKNTSVSRNRFYKTLVSCGC